MPDGTELDAQIGESQFVVTAIGTGDSLAELGGQLAWLGAALRSSHSEVGVTTCSPFLGGLQVLDTAGKAPGSTSMPLCEIIYPIHFEMSDPVETADEQAGECWHHMFRNPVMVSGYPTLAKPNGLGVEMPLNMMAALAGSDRAVEFDGKIFVKGFSTMLIGTRIMEDLLVWHYHYNVKGERISYLDHNHQSIGGIDLYQLQTVRHVVGWCSKSEYYAG